jgi:hypothetical protein
MRKQRGPYRYRRLQILEGYGSDPYRPGRKPAGPVHCPGCGALFSKGRWRWGEAPAGARKGRCPACRRKDEGVPGGYVAISGEFFGKHRAEVLARIRHCEAQEKARHPLERLIAIENEGREALVTTTSPHLARLLGHALEHAFKGDLSLSYNKQENLLRVRWSRAAA